MTDTVTINEISIPFVESLFAAPNILRLAETAQVNQWPDVLEPLILGLMKYIGVLGRTYEEVMDDWRTSYPRLAVWEDDSDCGLIDTVHVNGRWILRLTPSDLSMLAQRKTVPLRPL